MKSILLVDDDISILYLLGLVLESKEIEATKATNGVEAVKILKGKNFDMMITDFNMPRMDGIELAMIAKELHPDIHILMITGGELSPEFVETAANAGISTILSKPFNLRRLMAIIRGRHTLFVKNKVIQRHRIESNKVSLKM
jgi:CheY-like chemotaxis protein